MLERLVERGLLEPRGERRGRAYHLSAAVYRRIGQDAAYFRVRGFEPEQQKQMILQYARKHGKITRREVAELCRISDFQATRLLRSLVREVIARPRYRVGRLPEHENENWKGNLDE